MLSSHGKELSGDKLSEFIVTFVKLLQYEKALDPIEDTPDGIVTDDNPLHPSKA